MSYAKLGEEWNDLLTRRPTFREPLAHYGEIIETWARGPADRVAPLAWGAEECTHRWRQGVPLLAEAPPALAGEEMEDLLAPAMDLLIATGREADAMRRFAAAWDEAELTPADLFPRRGQIGSESAREKTGLSAEFLAFLAATSLRPLLEAYFLPCRLHSTDAWDLGVCPFCGAPPGFADVIEDGRRHLACHLCGGSWRFSRSRCPFCGNKNTKDLVRLDPEAAKEEGYFITACTACRAYLKELDRRVRWNAGCALVEDWGSPHLDLVATREGYWRPLPTLLQLVWA